MRWNMVALHEDDADDDEHGDEYGEHGECEGFGGATPWRSALRAVAGVPHSVTGTGP
ncbi:hypothetical protein [Streptomyces clavuligerus]|uniref:hypothetical protein n=1 Tax=Streptomyces clavuligerus TaxID=1901 RepID=UPI0001851EAD|nr:hypothetical protein [Streptomyces clavuligerus]